MTRSRTGRSRATARVVAGVVAVAVIVLAVLAPVAAFAAPTDVNDATGDESTSPAPTLRLQTMSPTVAHPGDVVHLVVQVDNRTDVALEDATLELGAGWKRLASRSDLEAWSAGEGPTPTTQLVEPVPDLAPGARKEVTLDLRVDSLDLNLGLRGPRQLSIVLRDGGRVVAQLRTFLLWDPSAGGASLRSDDDPVHLSLLAPVTGPPVDPADPLGTDQLSGVTAPGEPLARTLAAVDAAQQATGTRGALALAVDPALVAAAVSSDDAQVAAWGGAVEQLGDTTQVHPLPAYDPDLAALAHAGLSPTALQAATRTPLPGGWSVPSTWGAPLAWPAGEQAPDLATLGAARAAGLDTAVLPAGLAPLWGTATGLSTVTTEHGDVTTLVADGPISQALTDATNVRFNSTVSTPQAIQRLLAETAVVSSQNANDQPHLLAVLPRGWSPDLGSLRDALEALTASGWVEVAPLSDLFEAQEPTVDRTPLAADAAQDDELSPDDVRRLDAARTMLGELAGIATDPDAVAGPLAPALTAPTSVAWRSRPDERSDAVTDAVDAVAGLTGSLSAAATDVTLISAAGAIPIVVSNSLPFDAAVTVELRPDTPRLVVDSAPSVVVPAQGQSQVNVPVRALGSGDVEVTVRVLTAAGAQAATPITLHLSVRAGWETVGTAVAAGVVGLLFVVGIWRTIRRGRSARRTVDAAVSDPVIPSDAERP